MKASTHRLCTANLPSPLATPQPPHPPKAPEAASRRGRHGCGATPPRGCRVHHAARAMRHSELAATQWTEFESNPQSSTSPGESCTRLPAGLRPHRHLWCHWQSTWSDQKGTMWMTFASPTICTCLFHIFGLSMLANVVNKTAVPMALNIGKKHSISTNWPNIATKFSRGGTVRILLLSNWSSWRRAASAMHWTEFDSNSKTPTSPGESCARLPAGLRPHRHLWCHC